MATKTEICNLALDYVGKARIDIFGEGTAQGAACEAHYDIARQALLERSDWSFARAKAALATLASDYTTRWEYTYALPGLALRFLRVLTPDYDPRLNPVPVPFEVRDRKVYTNVETAFGEFTTDVDDTTLFASTFVDALAFSLAARIAWPLSKSRTLVVDLREQAARALSVAVTADAAQDVTRYAYDGAGVIARQIGSHPFWGQ